MMIKVRALLMVIPCLGGVSQRGGTDPKAAASLCPASGAILENLVDTEAPRSRLWLHCRGSRCCVGCGPFCAFLLKKESKSFSSPQNESEAAASLSKTQPALVQSWIHFWSAI